MSTNDERWRQRLVSFGRAMRQLDAALAQQELSDLEREGLIQRFEYCYELAWKTLQDLLACKGYIDIKGPNPVLQQALKDGYIAGAEDWREMREARGLTSHTYDGATVLAIAEKIKHQFSALLHALENRLLRETG